MYKKPEPKKNVSKQKVWPKGEHRSSPPLSLNLIACGYFDCHLPFSKKHPQNAPKHPQTRTLKVGFFAKNLQLNFNEILTMTNKSNCIRHEPLVAKGNRRLSN